MKFDLHRSKICPFESVVIKCCTLHRCKSDENKTLPTRTNFPPSPHFHDCRNNGSKICCQSYRGVSIHRSIASLRLRAKECIIFHHLSILINVIENDSV